MTTQYTPILKLALPVTGELSGTWGTVVNDNITSMVEQAVAGLSTINTWTANAHTLTTADGTSSEARCAMLVLATGAGGTALTAAGEVICPAASKLYVVKNGSAYAVTVKTSAGTGVAIPAGDTAFVFCDGTNVNACVTTIVNGHISGNLTVDGNTTLGDATSDTITATARFNTDLLPSTDNARDLGSTANSWRTLYCETSVIAANITISGNTISSTDTNGNIVLAPNGNGDVQLDADTVRVGDSNVNVTITSNGTADLILNTNAGTNSGSITIQDGVDGNIVIAPNGNGQVQISNAVLDLTTIEVTNIKAKDGTASMTLADSTGVVTFSANPVLNAGTANGVPYLNASKVLTTGSALTFDGTNLDLATVGAKVNFATTSSATRNYVGGAADGFSLEMVTQRGALQPLSYKQDYAVGHAWSIAGSGAMTLTSTGLGIGTTSPLARLSVQLPTTSPAGYTAAANSGITLDCGTSTNGVINLVGGGDLGIFHSNSSNAYDVGIGFGNNANRHLTFVTANAERMRLDSSGNLGLGVTPSAKLEIYSTNNAFNALQVRYNGSNDAMGFGIGNSNGFPYLGYNTKSQASVDAPVYERSNPAAQLRMDNGSFKFNIAPSGTANTTTITNGVSYTIITSGNQTDFGAANNNVGTSFTATSSGTLSSGTVSQNISFTQAMTLDASGRLLVGLTADTAAGGYFGIIQAQGSYPAIVLKGTETSAKTWQIGENAGSLAFYNTTDGERARITSGGDLLVGTTNAANANAKIRSSSGIEYSNSVLFNVQNPNGKVFTVTGGSNGQSTFVEIEVLTYEGYFKAVYFCANASGSWENDKYNEVTSGTPATVTVAGNNTATITFTVACTTSYTPLMRVAMGNQFVSMA